jgi:hypothetical protein
MICSERSHLSCYPLNDGHLDCIAGSAIQSFICGNLNFYASSAKNYNIISSNNDKIMKQTPFLWE